MRTIGIFMDSFHIGGVQKVFITLANELIRQGYEVTVLTLNTEGELKDEIDSRIFVINLNVPHIRSVFFKIGKFLTRENFDILLTGKDAENLFFVANKLCFRYKTKLFISQHNHLIPESESVHGFYQMVILRAIKHFYKRADGVICVSKGIKEALIEIGIPENKLKVIYNPLDVERVKAMAEEAPDVIIPKPYIMFVGRFSPIKNLEFLIRSFAIFSRTNPNYRLVLAGDGAERVKLEGIAKEERIDNNTIFLGAISNPYCYLQNTELLLLSSLKEAFSMVAIEALALGKTVVSTNSGGPSEILEQNKGYIVNSFDNMDLFAKTIEKALENKIDPVLLKNYANSFSVKEITEQYKHVFES